MTLIGLISDVHATPEPVAEALSIFAKAGVAQVLCAGDIAGYCENLEPTISLLRENNCLTIVGNHDLSYLEQHVDGYDDKADSASIDFLKTLPNTYSTNIAGKSLYMVHAQPPDGCHGGIKLLDKKGELIEDNVAQWATKLQNFDYDILIIGHTHQVFAEQIAGTLVINPGSSVFNHCCAILALPEMTVELFPLSGKSIKKTWNWGEHMIHKKSI